MSNTESKRHSAIVLKVRGLGPVPSFKTGKGAVINNQTGLPMKITRSDHRRWMAECIRSFESQLRCAMQEIQQAQTLMEPGQRSSIAWFAPLNDSRKWLKEIHITWEQVEPGMEGADILIERL